jgi:hypothetical protein
MSWIESEEPAPEQSADLRSEIAPVIDLGSKTHVRAVVNASPGTSGPVNGSKFDREVSAKIPPVGSQLGSCIDQAIIDESQVKGLEVLQKGLTVGANSGGADTL